MLSCVFLFSSNFFCKHACYYEKYGDGLLCLLECLFQILPFFSKNQFPFLWILFLERSAKSGHAVIIVAVHSLSIFSNIHARVVVVLHHFYGCHVHWYWTCHIFIGCKIYVKSAVIHISCNYNSSLNLSSRHVHKTSKLNPISKNKTAHKKLFQICILHEFSAMTFFE